MSRFSIGLNSDITNLSEKVVAVLPAGTTTVNPEVYANRNAILLGQATSAVTVKLPQAVGSGDVYRFLNTVARTSGSLTFQLVNTASTFNAQIEAIDSAAVATNTNSWFLTNATQILLNITTTGGLGGDWLEFLDGAAGQWYVRGYTRCSGSKATPLS